MTPAGGESDLANDLDCTGLAAPAVRITHGALNLRGFNVKGGTVGIQCDSTCKIRGAGTVSDALIGINAYGRLRLVGVDVTNNTTMGVQCYTGCEVSSGSISNNGDPLEESFGHGITSTGTLKLDGVTIADNTGHGIQVGSYPQPRGKVKARNTTVTGNRNGIVADHAAELKHSVVTGNREVGVSVGEAGCHGAGRLKLKDTSVLTGNGTSGDCGTTVACADLAACKEPKVKLSTCNTSYVIDSGIPGSDWDACTAD